MGAERNPTQPDPSPTHNVDWLVLRPNLAHPAPCLDTYLCQWMLWTGPMWPELLVCKQVMWSGLVWAALSLGSCTELQRLNSEKVVPHVSLSGLLKVADLTHCVLGHCWLTQSISVLVGTMSLPIWPTSFLFLTLGVSGQLHLIYSKTLVSIDSVEGKT